MLQPPPTLCLRRHLGGKWYRKTTIWTQLGCQAIYIKQRHGLNKLYLKTTHKSYFWGLARYWPPRVATRLQGLDIWKWLIYLKKDGMLDLYEVTKRYSFNKFGMGPLGKHYWPYWHYWHYWGSRIQFFFCMSILGYFFSWHFPNLKPHYFLKFWLSYFFGVWSDLCLMLLNMWNTM